LIGLNGKGRPAVIDFRREVTMKLSIELSSTEAERLQEEARRLGVTAERLAGAAVADLLGRERDDFESAAAKVLEKNRELYRRLA
jgi:predicted transcriptional regulator